MMGIGMKERGCVDHNAHMPAPEHQVAPLKRRGLYRMAYGQLLVCIPGKGDATGQERLLNKA